MTITDPFVEAISHLPRLWRLFAGGNRLIELPSNLPDKLDQVDFDDNPELPVELQKYRPFGKAWEDLRLRLRGSFPIPWFCEKYSGCCLSAKDYQSLDPCEQCKMIVRHLVGDEGTKLLFVDDRVQFEDPRVYDMMRRSFYAPLLVTIQAAVRGFVARLLDSRHRAQPGARDLLQRNVARFLLQHTSGWSRLLRSGWGGLPNFIGHDECEQGLLLNQRVAMRHQALAQQVTSLWTFRAVYRFGKSPESCQLRAAVNAPLLNAICAQLWKEAVASASLLEDVVAYTGGLRCLSPHESLATRMEVAQIAGPMILCAECKVSMRPLTQTRFVCFGCHSNKTADLCVQCAKKHNDVGHALGSYGFPNGFTVFYFRSPFHKYLWRAAEQWGDEAVHDADVAAKAWCRGLPEGVVKSVSARLANKTGRDHFW